MVSSEPVVSKYDVMEIKDMITAHVAYTNSEKGKEILNDLANIYRSLRKSFHTITRKCSRRFPKWKEKVLAQSRHRLKHFTKLKEDRRRALWGKPTGFLEYERKESVGEAPLKRIKHFNEFHIPLSREEQQKQGARCMDCGVPFCQSGKVLLNGMASGCPLNNLVPEWNDLIYTGNWNRHT